MGHVVGLVVRPGLLLALGLLIRWSQPPDDCALVAGWVLAIETPTHGTTRWWMPNAPERACGAEVSTGSLPAPAPHAGARVWLKTIVRPRLLGTAWSAPIVVTP